jgi:hypothetical protein
VVVHDLGVVAAWGKAALSSVALIGGTLQWSEAPLVGVDDLLATRELELAATKSLMHVLLVVVSATDGDEDLTNVDTSDQTSGLTEGTTHSGLETIGVDGLVHTSHIHAQ